MSLLSLSQPLLVKVAGKILAKAAEDQSSEIGASIKTKIEEYVAGTDSAYDDVALEAVEELLESAEYADKARELLTEGRRYINSTSTNVDDLLLLPVLNIVENMLPEASAEEETEETAEGTEESSEKTAAEGSSDETATA